MLIIGESGVFMCKVKTGSSVKTTSDLQNLVTGTIFRESASFTISEIQNRVLSHLDGSRFKDDEHSWIVEKMCEQTVKTMGLSDDIYEDANHRFHLSTTFPAYPLSK